MAIFTTLTGERVQTSKNKDGSINRTVLSTGNPVTATHSGSRDKKTGANTVDVYNKSIGYSADGKKKIVSSNSVISDKNKMDSRLQAGAALTSNPSDYTQGGGQQGFLSPGDQGYLNLLNDQQGQYMDDQQGMINMVKLKYDTAMRRSNQQYNNLLTDLETNLQNDANMATQQAAALNPYSQAQGAMTARNFQGAITEKYQKQAIRIQEAASAAEEALRAGEMEAYMNISNSMKESNRNFQKGMMEYMLGAQKEFNANQMQQKEFGLKQQTFDLQSAQAYEGNFMDFVDTFGADPNFQGEINNFFQTGEIGESLMPLVKRGMQAGMSPDEAISVAQYETQEQKKIRQNQEQFNQSMSLGWYNAQTSRISADTARTKAMQDALAANEGISNVRAEKASIIIDNGMRAFDVLNTGNGKATGLGATASLWLPGESTQADTLQGYYDTILNNISLTEMQKMKDESKQGSTGFGNQSDKEFTTLRESMGKLSAQNDPAVQKINLAKIMAAQHNIVQLHAAATGQMNQSPMMMTYQDVLNEMSPSAPSATEWKSPSGKVYKF